VTSIAGAAPGRARDDPHVAIFGKNVEDAFGHVRHLASSSGSRPGSSRRPPSPPIRAADDATGAIV